MIIEMTTFLELGRLTALYIFFFTGTVNYILSFMTNVTISISISQIFRSCVAIYQHRPPLASLSHSLYDIPGLAPPMNVIFWGRHDFQISFSNSDTSRNTWNRHWRSFIMGMLSSKIEKVQRGIRGEKSSKDMASSRNLVSTIGALASPKMGDGTRCPEG